MEDLLKPETFAFFAHFLLSGYVFLLTTSAFVAHARPKPAEMLVEAVVLSLLNRLVLLVTFEWWGPIAAGPDFSPLLLALQTVGQPVILGLAVGLLARRGRMPRVLYRVLQPASEADRGALRFALERMRSAGFLIVTLRDGPTVYGYFGRSSLAEIDKSNGGIYVERLYSVGDDLAWTEVEPRRGCWLALSEIRSIELIPRE